MHEKKIINAFHPDYVKTYEPDLMKHFKHIDAHKRSSMTMSDNVEEYRKTDPAHGYLSIGKVPREINAPKMMKRKKVDLAPKEFHVYQKAKPSK